MEERDLRKSFIEVYETTFSEENFILKDNKDNNKKILLDKNNETYKYVLELEKYLFVGANLLEIYIIDNSDRRETTVHLLTTINKDGNKIEISQKHFNIRP
ncbi:hypothetical protein Pryu01_01908 [Paraliobacillus ryukyuensis]|uniref:Uncharacterized protein n=1 Tax=Paraliobacillus ryukyuensis TaxID=200904 RepID=A0A366DZ67_9BACI|nr:hypothetical protein [Paraliobacillus ryukyuensis]RBO95175.1 hypothetical protein DES48_10911 [Paraliobacillus ryukyuensis]